MKILHIINESIFAIEVLKRVRKLFNYNEHHFIVIKQNGKFIDKLKGKNVFYAEDINCNRTCIYIIKKMLISDKIILYALTGNININLVLAPILGKKYCWICWGGELYDYNLGYLGDGKKTKYYEYKKKLIINHTGFICAWHRKEYLDALKYYPNTKAKFIEMFMPYKIYVKPNEVIGNNCKHVRIMIGHSGSNINQHLDAMNKLLFLADENIEIICPMTYASNKSYMKKVKNTGQKYFGEKFKLLNQEWMSDSEYQKFLSTIDIAVFNNKREQAFGNIQILLLQGKKVYINKSNVALFTFKDLSGNLFEFKDFSLNEKQEFLNPLSEVQKEENYKMIKEYSSDKHYMEVWSNIFNGAYESDKLHYK